MTCNLYNDIIIINKRINILNGYEISEDEYYDDPDDFYKAKKFEFIKIKYTNYKKWNEDRYIDNLKKISESKSTIPILVRYIRENKYEIQNGNHRCYVCNELGYEEIPAYVYYE